MEKLTNKCPYLVPVAPRDTKQTTIQKQYELQYNDQHIVEEVEIDELDLIKEVNSHVNEVGLVNVFRNAIAHGEDPYTKFAKTEDGVPFAFDENATLDDLIQESNKNKAKLEEIAKTLGVSVDELIKAVQNGSLHQLLTKPDVDDNKEKDGEE